MELKEFTPPKKVNFFDIPAVKERFSAVAPQIEVSNFLLGAAYCGNSEEPLIGGLDDSRNGLTQEQKGRIVLDALQQLMLLTEKAKSDFTVTVQENSRLLFIAVSLIEMCNDSQQIQLSKWPSFKIPIEVRQAVDRWGKETWNEEWAKAIDNSSNSWFIESGIAMADSDYLGVDFIGHWIGAIMQKATPLPADFSKPWDNISFLRAFWEQHRPPTAWERLLGRVPKSPFR